MPIHDKSIMISGNKQGSSRACSLRGNALVAPAGNFILFTLAVKSEHHPEMLESLITASTFRMEKEKDHVYRDHLWNRNLVELCSLPFEVWLRKFAEWPQSSSCMSPGDSQNFPGYTEHSCSNMFVQNHVFPPQKHCNLDVTIAPEIWF